MPAIPSSHISDAHKLDADGKIVLYKLEPSVGSGSIFFKSDADVTWLGDTYSGIGLQLEGESYTSQGTAPQPTLTIGQNDIDLSPFKPLIWSGGLDNARITRYKVLLTDLLANNNIKETTVFRVKRVEGYSSTKIQLVLSVFSPSGPTTLPFRQYVPPAFPFVVL